jgi:chorismate mutase
MTSTPRPVQPSRTRVAAQTRLQRAAEKLERAKADFDAAASAARSEPVFDPAVAQQRLAELKASSKVYTAAVRAAATATTKRDALILRAYKAGATTKTIAVAANLSSPSISRLTAGTERNKRPNPDSADSAVTELETLAGTVDNLDTAAVEALNHRNIAAEAAFSAGVKLHQIADAIGVAHNQAAHRVVQAGRRALDGTLAVRARRN